jgi:hypothetical protein
MKNLMEKIAIVVFVVIVIVICKNGGCVKNIWHDENIEENYRAYWEYSLGDYEYECEVKKDNGGGSGGFSVNKWYEYTFYFKDVNGNDRNVVVSSYLFDDLNRDILYCVNDLIEEDVNKLFENRLFVEMDGVKSHKYVFRCEAKRVDESIDLYDNRKGLKLSEISLNTLRKNNIEVVIRTNIILDKGIKYYTDLKDKLIEGVDFIFEDYEYTNIKFEFRINSSDDYYDTFYYLEYDGSEYKWSERYMGDEK